MFLWLKSWRYIQVPVWNLPPLYFLDDPDCVKTIDRKRSQLVLTVDQWHHQGKNWFPIKPSSCLWKDCTNKYTTTIKHIVSVIKKGSLSPSVSFLTLFNAHNVYINANIGSYLSFETPVQNPKQVKSLISILHRNRLYEIMWMKKGTFYYFT